MMHMYIMFIHLFGLFINDTGSIRLSNIDNVSVMVLQSDNVMFFNI